MAYSTKDDLRIGDIRLPVRYGDGSSFVVSAAEEIDAQLGHIYVTPFVIDAQVAQNRPAILILKKINNLIASGRLIMDMAASQEDTTLHAYGWAMLKEGLELLKALQSRSILLTGSTLIDYDGDGQKTPTGPLIHNVDTESRVEGFYDSPYPLVYGGGVNWPYGGR